MPPFAVVPNAGVPPAHVLQKLVPGESLAALEEWTASQYRDLKDDLKNQSDWRTANLDGTNCARYPSHTCVGGNFQRRKREDAAEVDQGRYSMQLDNTLLMKHEIVHLCKMVHSCASFWR